MFPYPSEVTKQPDIVEVRCNIEVHEQIQQQDLDLEDPFDESCPNALQNPDINTSSDQLVNDTVLSSPFQLSTDYKFNRIAGHHVEIHFDFTEQGFDCVKVSLSDVLKLYLKEKMHVCEAITSAVNSEF